MIVLIVIVFILFIVLLIELKSYFIEEETIIDSNLKHKEDVVKVEEDHKNKWEKYDKVIKFYNY